jgi:hypothetical protein
LTNDRLDVVENSNSREKYITFLCDEACL